MRSRLAATLGLAALFGCQTAPVRQMPPLGGTAATAPSAALSEQTCETRNNGALGKLEACMRRDWLWHHLAEFQRIADAHPGPGGHGNRDTGTTGYLASVAYVAKLLRAAGYSVGIQPYIYRSIDVTGTPQFRVGGHHDVFERDWFVARNSGQDDLTAAVEPPRGALDGCSPSDFAGFARGAIALLQRGACDADTQVANAQQAGASAIILYDDAQDGIAAPARLVDPARVPVIGWASFALGADLLARYRSGRAPTAQVRVRNRYRSGMDYNVIADSRYGDPDRVVVVEGHLDSIYGAGMLDNASGSTTILQLALAMANTPTRNHLRYVWFGGEEIGLLGSRFYVKNLDPADLRRIKFDVDVDVTATPNFDFEIAAAKNAQRVKHFPRNVVPQSAIGNEYFRDYFAAAHLPVRANPGGSNGTDSISFALAGVPNTGILTQQDCCKRDWEVDLWGGYRGNYEGKVPSFNGGCVDYPHRWCDNLSNNDPFVFEVASRAVAYVAFELANRRNFRR